MTEPYKLHRKDATDTSIEAAHSINASRLEQLVYNTILSFGVNGCISDDVRKLHPECSYSSITARYRSLLDGNFIVDTGHRRAGDSGKRQRVMVAKILLKGV